MMHRSAGKPSRTATGGREVRLSRFLIGRIAAVSAAILAGALLLALWQARLNIAGEERGAAAVARMFDHLAALEAGPAADVPAHLEALRRIVGEGRMRHLQLRLQDGAGRDLLTPPAHAHGLLQRAYAWLLPPAYGGARPQAPHWNLQRDDGRQYHATLQLDPDSERSESLADIAGLLGILLGYAALTLLAVYAALQLALRPLRDILGAIDQYGHDRYDYRLPPMRLYELHTVAQALHRMAQALARSQEARRRLDLQLRTMQEDERSRLARELHDELGQRLTAMRADAAWLVRRSDGQPELHDVACSLAEQGAQVQAIVRGLLQRLRLRHGDGPPPLGRLLRDLVDSWRGRPEQRTRFELRVDVDDGSLPGETALALYRLTQEALTNVARHAGASRVDIHVQRLPDGRLEWTVCDDGRGLDDPARAKRRGHGLAGMCERVWALHGEIEIAPADPAGGDRPGLRLRARLPMDAVAPAGPDDGTARGDAATRARDAQQASASKP